MWLSPWVVSPAKVMAESKGVEARHSEDLNANTSWVAAQCTIPSDCCVAWGHFIQGWDRLLDYKGIQNYDEWAGKLRPTVRPAIILLNSRSIRSPFSRYWDLMLKKILLKCLWMLETKETGVAKYKVLKLLVKGMDGWYFGLESFRLTGVGGRNLENKCVHCESTVQLQELSRPSTGGNWRMMFLVWTPVTVWRRVLIRNVIYLRPNISTCGSMKHYGFIIVPIKYPGMCGNVKRSTSANWCWCF